MERSQQAAHRALQLDPDLIDAAMRLIVQRTEDGQIVEAYREAKQLVSRRPESAQAHFVLSYALRYGGALQEAATECNTALSLDRGDRGLRSCALVFQELNDYPRALEFARLDAGSEWSAGVVAEIFLRQGKLAEALAISVNTPRRRILSDWAIHAPDAQIDADVAKLLQVRPGRGDGEPLFLNAGVLTYCNRADVALDFMRRAVERNYCSYPAMDSDPLLAPARRLPGYAAVHAAAVACHARFLRERDQK